VSSGDQPATIPLRADLVFEGGGVKGIGLAGAYRELSDRGYQPQCVAGTSAGAITAALVAVGYTGAELQDIVLHQMKFAEFEDPTFMDHFGMAGGAVQFFVSRGMHSGNHFLDWMGQRLEAKGITRFGQLRVPGDTQGGTRAYRLQVIASDLSGRRMLVLPHDASLLGLDPDELEIAQAVRMSMSIPIFFEPVTVRNPQTQAEHVIVDGGLLSNYPIWLFDAPAGSVPEYPTFGMLLVAPGQQAPLIPPPPAGEEVVPIGSDVGFLKAIGETMMEAHDRFYVEQANYARTIPIPTLGVKTTEFDIPPEKAAALFESGRSAAAKFLDAWDFQAYIARFRQAPPPSRTDTLRAQLRAPGSA
jgi:NTE family protein